MSIHHLTSPMLCTLLFACAPFAVAQPAPQPAADSPEAAARVHLEAWYAGKDEPPWQQALADLKSDDEGTAIRASRYLLALLNQATKDERSGKAPWQATPFWGGGAENPAVKLRGWVAAAFREGDVPQRAVSVLAWLLKEETQPRAVASAGAAVARLKSPEADALLVEMIRQPHPNEKVLAGALGQVAPRALVVQDADLSPLTNHHRKAIREAARTAWTDTGRGDLPPFDPAMAMESPAIRAVLEAVGQLLVDVPPPDAKFVTVKMDGGNRQMQGWVLASDDTTLTLLTHAGRHRELATATCSVSEQPVADVVKMVVALRAAGDPEYELSEKGGLTGQFEGGCSLFEILLAWWLDSTGRKSDAAAILMPALDQLWQDDHMAQIAAQRLGMICGQRMLVEFVGNRDYPTALKLAEEVVRRYPDTQYARHATGLQRQLPRRMEDFDTFTLPTPEQWAALRKDMDRPAQIDYLCQHLRLINAYQWGQPGGVNIEVGQYAEPQGLSENAAWGGRAKGTVVRGATR